MVTAGSPHSRRAGNTTSTTTTANPITADTTTRTRGGILSYSQHPELDLSGGDDEDEQKPAAHPPGNNISPLETMGGNVESTADGGDIATATTRAPTLTDLFAELDILRKQATNIQSQLDGQRTISQEFSRSITSINHSLDTLRDATKANCDGVSRAIAIADDATKTVLGFKTVTSDLSYKIHTISTRVDKLIEDQATTGIPPTTSSTIEDAFAAADAAISDGLNSMEREIGSRLDRNISSASTPVSSPPSVRFANVTDRWSHKDPYDSDAAYSAAHGSTASTTADGKDESLSPARDACSTTAVNNNSVGDGQRDSSHGSFGDSLSPRYNGPTSPRHRLALTRGLDPCILAWHAGVEAGGDPVVGVDLMEDPDVEALGVPPEFAVDVAEDHMDIVENWTNPRWLQRDARDFNATEFGYSAPSTGGPNITDILKQITNWDKLSDLSPTGWHAFYNRLRRFSFKWKIALMPFGAINMKYQCFGHGLCTCGLGLDRYRRMGDALFLVLEYLLPVSNPIIATTLATLATRPHTANGYTLLWTLLKEFIPMLDHTTPTQLPTWPESDDIFQFARLVLMYCDLSQHRGPPYSDAMKSRLFLSNVRGRYTSMASQFTALVGTYCPGRDGSVHCSDPLPRHLSVLELARTFYDEATRLDASMPVAFTPSIHAHQTRAPSIPPQAITDVPSPSLRSPTSSITHETHPNSPPPTRPIHIQGYCANATRAPSTYRRTAPNPSSRQSRSPPRNRYESACEACGKYGHPANRCDMLAMALFIQRYCKNRSNAELMKALEAHWIERNKPFLPRDDRTPRTILANYCAEFEYDEDKVDLEMDWDYLHDPTSVEEDDE